MTAESATDWLSRQPSATSTSSRMRSSGPGASRSSQCRPASVPGAVGCLVARGRQCRPDGPSRPVSAAAGPEGDRDWQSRRRRRPSTGNHGHSAAWPDVATLRGSLSPSSKHPTSLRLITCRKSPPRALAARNGSCAYASITNIYPKRPFDLCHVCARCVLPAQADGLASLAAGEEREQAPGHKPVVGDLAQNGRRGLDGEALTVGAALRACRRNQRSKTAGGLRVRHAHLDVNTAIKWCKVMFDTLARRGPPWRSTSL
jgi:hypothetical protein